MTALFGLIVVELCEKWTGDPPAELNKQRSLITCPHEHTPATAANPPLRKTWLSYTSVFHFKEKIWTPLKEMKKQRSEYKWNCLRSAVWNVTKHWATQKVTNAHVSKNGLSMPCEVLDVSKSSKLKDKSTKVLLRTLRLTTWGCFWEIHMKWRPPHSAPTLLSWPHLASTCPRRAALIIHVYSIEFLLMATFLQNDLIPK